jgi:hypothetical protein
LLKRLNQDVRYVGHIACMREIRYEYKLVAENLRERKSVEDLGVNGATIKWILTGSRV